MATVRLTRELVINVRGYDREPTVYAPGTHEVPASVAAWVAAHPDVGQVLGEKKPAATTKAETPSEESTSLWVLRDTGSGEYVVRLEADAYATGDIADALTFEAEAEAAAAAEGREGVEVVSVNVGEHPQPAELLTGKAADVAKLVSQADDLETLRLLRAAEAEGANRKSVLAAIDARIAELEA